MKRQISDSIPCGILLALSGGCMDAYSYLFRDHIFANAQTGNMLLFGVNLANGDIFEALRYLWPVLAFTAGIILSDIINQKSSVIRIHWRQISVLVEAVILAIVSFMSVELNPVANVMISFACGIQVESFRKIHGNSIATTMCIGNLRSGTYNLDRYLDTGENSYLRKAVLYYGVIASFVVGAVIESRCISFMGNKAILLSVLLLLSALIIMFRKADGDDGDNFVD